VKGAFCSAAAAAAASVVVLLLLLLQLHSAPSHVVRSLFLSQLNDTLGCACRSHAVSLVALPEVHLAH
jgi:hypothetical protein